MAIILLAFGPCVVVVYGWNRLCTLGRAPHTKETPPDFHKWCRVTRHSRIFRRLTGCQRTPRFWGITHSHLISRLPGAYEMHYAISTILYQYIICIYSQFFYNHTTCNSTISTITQISSFEQITISSPMAYTHNYIPYNCDIMLTPQALTN